MDIEMDINTIPDDVLTAESIALVPTGINGRIKRIIDLALAIPLALFVAPLLIVIALIVKCQDGGPALFQQTRCGRNGIAFTCFKFRTMHHHGPKTIDEIIAVRPELAAEWEEHHKLRHDPRITKLGQFLRKSSLDELPQLFNILRGDMTIVGPRPVTFEELVKYKADVVFYKAARPGVTGLWQINGRNDTTYEERVAYDRDYVTNWTLKRDIGILAKTIPVIISAKGAY